MEEIFKTWAGLMATGIEAGAAVVIGIATLIAIVQSLVLFVRRHHAIDEKEVIRLQLGRWLAVALEIELAADILRTAISPSWADIGKVAAIVVLRTVLNYFLEKDIEKAAARRGQSVSNASVAAPPPHGSHDGSPARVA